MQAAPTRIAILLCTHDGARFLASQLDSLAAQTLPPAAIFIHDWGSTDTTRQMLADFAQRAHGTDGVKIPVAVTLHDGAPGAHRSFVSGMRHCLGSDLPFDHLALCDQDDEWLPDKLATYARHMAQHPPGPDLLCSDVALVDTDGAPLAPGFYGPRSPFHPPARLDDPSLLLVNPVIGMTLCIRRDRLAELAPLLDGDWLMHDWALVLLAAARGLTIRYVAQPLVRYRQHAANVLGAAQGLRVRVRLMKARAHFARLRAQMARLQACGGMPHSRAGAALLVPGPMQRWRAATVAARSGLLKPHMAWLLGAAALLLW